MIGILDIGSNTIRLVTYKNGEYISNINIASEILKDTVDNKLTELGTQKLCDTILTLKKKAGDIKIFSFATYAFRELENREEVKNKVLEKTGIFIDVLSGKEEAECDFCGLMKEIEKNENGIGVDLGGGSAQIFTFSDGVLDFCQSYPIGSKRIKETFIKEKFPTPEEKIKVENYIDKTLADFDKKSENLYMMGGTAKTAEKMNTFLKGQDMGGKIEVSQLPHIIKFIEEAPEDIMKNVLKARYDNIVAGIIIMDKIAQKCGANNIYVKKCSVRDGYIIKRDIKE